MSTRKQNSRFVDAPLAERCRWNITLRDGSLAQCGRRRMAGGWQCSQHQKIRERDFACCGGSDEWPPEHTQDCERNLVDVTVGRETDVLSGGIYIARQYSNCTVKLHLTEEQAAEVLKRLAEVLRSTSKTV